MSYNGYSALNGLPKNYQEQFRTARTRLQNAGIRVVRTKYDYAHYFVYIDGKEVICSIWDVIRIAEGLR